jgi:hypothetical protein
MAIQLEAFQKGDVYIDYAFEDAKFRYEKQTGKVYRRFYGQAEDEIRADSDLYHQAISSGRQIARDEYYADTTHAEQQTAKAPPRSAPDPGPELRSTPPETCACGCTQFYRDAEKGLYQCHMCGGEYLVRTRSD